jgi:hypothetical protein
MCYFRGLTWLSVGQSQKGLDDLQNALDLFRKGNHKSWADQCEQNIQQGKELLENKKK